MEGESNYKLRAYFMCSILLIYTVFYVVTYLANLNMIELQNYVNYFAYICFVRKKQQNLARLIWDDNMNIYIIDAEIYI
jgi:hypothetical protein